MKQGQTWEINLRERGQTLEGSSKVSGSCLVLRELPKNNLRILLALLPVFYVVTTGT